MLSIANEVNSFIFRCVCFVCDTNMYFSNTLFFVDLVILFWNLMLFVLLGHLADHGVEIGVCGVVGMWQIGVLVSRFAMGCFLKIAS